MSERIPPEDSSFSKKVEAVLLRMEGDRRLKRTKTAFAKLLGCSRGTLYNLGWPITRYEEFRLKEKVQAGRRQRPSDTTHVFDPVKSDKEILGWKRKCDALKAENENLKERIEQLRERLRRGGDPSGGGNVLPFSPKGD